MKLYQSRLFAAGAVLMGTLLATGPVLGWQESDPPSQDQTDATIKRAKGEAALAEALEHLANRRWRRAIQTFETSLQYLPGNQEALQGLARAQAQWDAAPILDNVADDLEVLLQRARVEYDASMQQARARLAQGDFNGAEPPVRPAQTPPRPGGALFPPGAASGRAHRRGRRGPRRRAAPGPRPRDMKGWHGR